MKAFLSMGWALLTFRAGPDALPYAPRLIVPLLLLNLAISFGIQSIADSGMEKPVLQLSAMALAAEAFWLAFCLQRRGWINRWSQSFMALVLVDTWISALALPIALITVQGNDALLGIAAILQIAMTLWSLNVRGFVYAQTLGISRLRGIFQAMVPILLVMVVALTLFPEILPKPPAPVAEPVIPAMTPEP
jgi:hypothetical protein